MTTVNGSPLTQPPLPTAQPAKELVINVRNFGASGLGIQEDTQAFLDAIQLAELMGGGIVFVPPGKYLIRSLGVLPAGVSLQGVYTRDTSRNTGSWLYCVDNANPAIQLAGYQSVEDLAFYYPQQSWTGVQPGIAYPPTLQLQAGAKHVTLRDLFPQNSYFFLDASAAHENLTAENIHGYAINQVFAIDNNTDVDTLRNIHFNQNALAGDPNQNNFGAWTRAHGMAFTVLRADWPVFDNVFCWGYRKGWHFDQNGQGGSPGGVHMVNCGADACGSALQTLAGNGYVLTNCFWTQLNGFTAGQDDDNQAIDFAGGNDVVMVANRFWGVDNACIHVNVDEILIEGCSFYQFGVTGTAANNWRAIVKDQGRMIVKGCYFDGENRTGVYGILMQEGAGVAATSSSIVEGNVFKNFPASPVSSINSANNIVAANNLFENCPGGTIGLNNAPANFTNTGNLSY